MQCPLVTYRSGGNGHGCDDGDAMAMLVTMTVALWHWCDEVVMMMGKTMVV